VSAEAEIGERFDCFGSSCAVFVIGAGREASAREAVDRVRRSLLGWHERFSRFRPNSELSCLNRDPRTRVPVSPLMARFANAVLSAGFLTAGLVDATLIDQIESAGYAGELRDPLPLSRALSLAPPRRPARAAKAARWHELEVSLADHTVKRPIGVRLDSGGLAKGLFADVLAEELADHPSFAINCAGDLVIGGREGYSRPIHVESPFDGRTLHTFESTRTGVATSGIGRRAWLDARGRPAHHLLDPSSGEPAYTGVVQATALAPSALMAEIHAKAAILSGPGAARGWLPHGGVIVLDDGSHEVIRPTPAVTLSQRSAHAQRPPSSARQHG
jgi:thiamine biosynthesis lipoprotein